MCSVHLCWDVSCIRLIGKLNHEQHLLELDASPISLVIFLSLTIAHLDLSNMFCLTSASKAVEILEAFEGTLEDDYPPENELCEHTEMILYKVSSKNCTSVILLLCLDSLVLFPWKTMLVVKGSM